MKMQIVPPLVILLLIAGTGCGPSPDSRSSASANGGPTRSPPVSWTIEPLAAPIAAKAATVQIRGHINPGWHIYSTTQQAGGPVATSITLPGGQPFAAAGKPQPVTRPAVTYDDAFRMKVEVHEHDAEFLVPVRAVSPVASADSVRIDVRYQVCNDSLCYPPQTAHLAAAVPAHHA